MVGSAAWCRGRTSWPAASEGAQEERCAPMFQYHLWCLYLYKAESEWKYVDLISGCMFSLCKIVAVTKCGYSVAEGCTSNGDDGLITYDCEMAYINTHQSIFRRRRDTFAQSWCKKRGCLWWAYSWRDNKNGAPFWNHKNGRRNLWFKALFWEWRAMGQQHCSACGPSKVGLKFWMSPKEVVFQW